MKFFPILFIILLISFFLSSICTKQNILRRLDDKDKKEIEELTVHFNLSEPELKIPEDNDIKDFKAKPKSSIVMPSTKLSKSGYTFQGWTKDGYHGYEPGSVTQISNQNLTFNPVFVNKNDKNYYTIKYHVELDGDVQDVSDKLPPYHIKENTIYPTPLYAFTTNIAMQFGWQYEGYEFITGECIVMPSKDIVLTPIWHYYHTIAYYAGDVDGIIGTKYEKYQQAEGFTRELPEETRFARKGYKIIGWHCTYDDQDYETLFSYKMPDDDVDFYAIWEPKDYVVVFIPGVSGMEYQRIKGKTGTIIIVPDIEKEREGYNFEGWKYEDKIYVPGDEFLIEGAIPGMGIGLKAVWTKKE